MEKSFIDMMLDATLVAQLVFLVLLIMSISSWTLIIHKWFALNSARRKAIDGLSRFTDARDLREAVQSLGGDSSSPLYHVAQQGVAEFNRLKEAGNSSEVVTDNVRRSLRQGVSESMASLASSVSFLATAANTAPFIGLLGTVWGILVAFQRIGAAKSASLATVAPVISEALVATAVGLFVAIPATMGYNTFLGIMQRIESELVNFAGVFLNRVQRELNANPDQKNERQNHGKHQAGSYAQQANQARGQSGGQFQQPYEQQNQNFVQQGGPAYTQPQAPYNPSASGYGQQDGAYGQAQQPTRPQGSMSMQGQTQSGAGSFQQTPGQGSVLGARPVRPK